MHKITVYAAGTDTRNQFTTPPDQRQVADLVAIHQNGNAAGSGGTIVRNPTFSSSWTHTSSMSWLRTPVTNASKMVDDGNFDNTNECWVAPSAWYTGVTYVYVDIPWSCVFYSAEEAGVQAHVRSSAGGTSVEEINGLFMKVPTGRYGRALTASGVIPDVRLQSGYSVEFRVYRETDGGAGTVDFRWGVRAHHAA